MTLHSVTSTVNMRHKPKIQIRYFQSNQKWLLLPEKNFFRLRSILYWGGSWNTFYHLNTLKGKGHKWHSYTWKLNDWCHCNGIGHSICRCLNVTYALFPLQVLKWHQPFNFSVSECHLCTYDVFTAFEVFIWWSCVDITYARKSVSEPVSFRISMKTPQRWRTSRVYAIVVFVILALLERRLTDGQTDRRTDGQTDRKTGPILLPRPLTREVKSPLEKWKTAFSEEI